MKSIRGFVFLSFSLLLNLLFILFFLNDLKSPIFITGNQRIILKKISKLKFKIIKDFMDFTFYELFSGFFISILSGTIFWSLGPTIIDRSLSVNILGTLYLAKEPLTLDQINWSLYENYMNGKFQTKKRINEQLYLGNIKIIENNRYILTKKGFKAAKVNIKISRFFNLDTSSSLPKLSPLNKKF